MKIAGSAGFAATSNYILSGYYDWSFSNGIKARLFELSSSSFGIDNFLAPYDAVLPSHSLSGNPYLAVGRRMKTATDTMRSNTSGKFYYYDEADLFGVCHGFGRDSDTYYLGYNFYQAFYPAGYFSPPFGETPSIFRANQDS